MGLRLPLPLPQHVAAAGMAMVIAVVMHVLVLMLQPPPPSASAGLFVREWAALKLAGSQRVADDHVVKSMARLTHAGPNAILVAEAWNKYLDRDEGMQQELLHEAWEGCSTLGNASAEEDCSEIHWDACKCQVDLLNAYLTVNLCPAVTSLLCDKRGLAAFAEGVRLPNGARLVPRSYVLRPPPFAPSNVSRLPRFPLVVPHLLKDPTKNEGKGVNILPAGTSFLSIASKLARGFVLQEYVVNPLLLMDKFKFTFELFAFVTSFAPLTLYLSWDGTVDASYVQWDKPPQNTDLPVSQLYKATHITNPNQQALLPGWGCDSHSALPPKARRFSYVEQMLSKQHVDVKRLRRDIAELVTTMFDSTIDAFAENEYQFDGATRKIDVRSICQELYGIDFLLEVLPGSAQPRPWIIEIQMQPNLDMRCDIEIPVLRKLAAGVWSTLQGKPRTDVFEQLLPAASN